MEKVWCSLRTWVNNKQFRFRQLQGRIYQNCWQRPSGRFSTKWFSTTDRVSEKGPLLLASQVANFLVELGGSPWPRTILRLFRNGCYGNQGKDVIISRVCRKNVVFGSAREEDFILKMTSYFQFATFCPARWCQLWQYCREGRLQDISHRFAIFLAPGLLIT